MSSFAIYHCTLLCHVSCLLVQLFLIYALRMFCILDRFSFWTLRESITQLQIWRGRFLFFSPQKKLLKPVFLRKPNHCLTEAKSFSEKIFSSDSTKDRKTVFRSYNNYQNLNPQVARLICITVRKRTLHGKVNYPFGG